ncbi:hypothetical protein MUO83_07875 [Candidatus Bathyarchaeota archaeon]|nr:hypothetical protein [Candidatus Bathyarchaeota archaeon]
MGLFGKKESTEFDKTQDARLAKIDSNMAILVTNNNYFIKHIQALETLNSQFSTKLSQLDKTLSALVVEHNKQVSLNEDQEKRLIKLEGV